jgi:hypothetical protein
MRFILVYEVFHGVKSLLIVSKTEVSFRYVCMLQFFMKIFSTLWSAKRRKNHVAHYSTQIVMCDVRCAICDVWCAMCDVWCVMCDVRCAMCDVRCATSRIYTANRCRHRVSNPVTQSPLKINQDALTTRPCSPFPNITRQDKTRQDKTRQDKTRQDTTRHDKTSTWIGCAEVLNWGMWVPELGALSPWVRQDKTRQDKTRQDKTRQDKTRQDKTRQDKTRHDKTRHDTTRHDTTRHDTTRHDTTRHDTARHGTTRHGTTRYVCILQYFMKIFSTLTSAKREKNHVAQYKTRQDKTRHGTTRHDTTRQVEKRVRWGPKSGDVSTWMGCAESLN